LISKICSRRRGSSHDQRHALEDLGRAAQKFAQAALDQQFDEGRAAVVEQLCAGSKLAVVVDLVGPNTQMVDGERR
jgi:hypothetical protein